MASKRKVIQLRYFGDHNGYLNSSEASAVYHRLDDNQPSNLSSFELQSGDAFTDYQPIVQLGIQALPGTKFKINHSIEPIIVGASGMFELDLDGTSAVATSLTFEKDSLDYIDKNPDGYLIIDIVYKEG